MTTQVCVWRHEQLMCCVVVCAVQVRGCAFPHTARRELVQAEAVNKALKDLNMPSGLVPAGVWDYAIKEEPLPKVTQHMHCAGGRFVFCLVAALSSRYGVCTPFHAR